MPPPHALTNIHDCQVRIVCWQYLRSSQQMLAVLQKVIKASPTSPASACVGILQHKSTSSFKQRCGKQAIASFYNMADQITQPQSRDKRSMHFLNGMEILPYGSLSQQSAPDLCTHCTNGLQYSYVIITTAQNKKECLKINVPSWNDTDLTLSHGFKSHQI